MLAVTNFTATSCLGRGNVAHTNALLNEKTGLRQESFTSLNTFVGRVDDLPSELPDGLENYMCRNNQLAWLAIQQDGFLAAARAAVEQFGAHRVAVIMGTSTSGIAATEDAFVAMVENGESTLPETFHYAETQSSFSIASFVAEVTGAAGPCFTISTACSSSAKVFASAHRYVAAGICDAVIVGGVDTLCGTTIYGFNSLQLVSNSICRPSDQNRDGLSIGEAGGFALLQKKSSGMHLLGYGESSDAHHMSTPDPEGRGAAQAMSLALQRAGLTASDISYLNLHGTSTPTNDGVEAKAVVSVMPKVPCSSTKGWTGHTLGAAGILESIIAMLSIQDDFIPKSLNTLLIDDDIEANVALETIQQPVRYAMSNSFGFGGNNCSVIFGEVV